MRQVLSPAKELTEVLEYGFVLLILLDFIDCIYFVDSLFFFPP